MSNRCFFAAHNSRADLSNGNRGFLNTWEVSRFPSTEARDVFVSKYENQAGKPVTRKEAESLFRENYLSTGKEIPAGGLFGADRFGMTNFWNEINAAGDDR